MLAGAGMLAAPGWHTMALVVMLLATTPGREVIIPSNAYLRPNKCLRLAADSM